jgi:apolipoprotein N-acyltransferase
VTPSRYGLSLALVGGIVFALTAPPTDVYPGVLVGLGALALALATATTLRRAFLLSWLFATSAALVGMRFIPSVVQRFTGLGWAGGVGALVLLAAGQAVGWGLGGVLVHFLRRRVGLAPGLAFGAGVFVAIVPTLVIAWTPAGVITPWPALVQLGEVVGERGVSFLIAVAAALLVAPLEPLLFGERPARRAFVAPALGAGLLALLAVYGAGRLIELSAREKDAPVLRVAVVQGAVEARLRWDPRAKDQILSRLRALTVEAEQQGVDLTIWPEAAYPHVLEHAPASMPRGRRGIVGGGVNGPVLFGVLTRAKQERAQHNAATLVAPDGRTQQPQAKLKLLWFGETVPFGDYIPALRRAFFRAGGLIPGESVELLRWRDARIGVLNCYEDTLPAVGRRVAEARPNLLVNLTNDAWFGLGAEPELHLRLSAMRAVESRLDLVRAVNLGAPAWIDAAGRVRARGSADRPGVMLVTPALHDSPPTLYTKAGDWPLLLVLAIAVGEAVWRRRRRREAIAVS